MIEWKEIKLQTIADVKGRIGWKGYTIKDLRDTGALAIGAGQINSQNKIDLSNAVFLSYEKYYESPEIMVEEGDVLLVQRGSLGKLVLIDKNIGKATINPSMVILKHISIDNKFLYYYFCSYEGQKLISDSSSQTGVPMISQEQILNFKLRIPINLTLQRHISHILYTCDAVIEKTEAAIAKYKAIKQGMLQDLFTRGIDNTTGRLRPKYENSPEIYKESKLGVIPNVWNVIRIDNLAKITTGGKDTQNKEKDGAYPFFVRSQTVEKISSYSYDGEAILTSGDGVGVGKIYHYINGKFDFHQRVYMLYEFTKIILPKFLFYYFSNNFLAEVDKYSAKTTVDSVRLEMIAGMVVPLPSIAEQIKISEKIITIESKLQSEQNYLQKLQQIKIGLMNDLLSGKKRVPLAN